MAIQWIQTPFGKNEKKSFSKMTRTASSRTFTLMEGLFDNPKKKYQKLLAVIDNHSSPVNCVRWNSIGTLFASAADDGSINLREYVGEMTINSAFQKFSYTMEQQPK
jgi:WD40 repeat protein